MFFGRKDNLVGLDIGSNTVKGAELVPSKTGWRLKKFGMLDLPPGSIEDGAIKDPEAIAETIRRLFRENRIKEQNIALSIGGYSVIVKNISTQTMPEEELQETIHFEAEQYIPFDINDVNLDFLILGENEKNPNQMDVLLIAVKKEIVDDYVNLIKLARLNPCVIDVDAFALQNIYEINYDIEQENVALIDIGASKTSLNILKDGTSVFIRDVSLGCAQISHRIAATADVPFEEAERIKLGKPSDKILPETLREIEAAVVAGWCSEIRRALDFFYSTYPEDTISRIVLSGGGAHIREFRYALAVETSVEVEAINPFKAIDVDDELFDAAFLAKTAPQAAICMGLALRRVNDK